MLQGKVALWSSLIFGVAHMANAIGGNEQALLQSIFAVVAGYFLYLIRRVSRGHVVPSVLHGLFDMTLIFSVDSVAVGSKNYVLGEMLPIVVYVACGIVVLIRRR